MTTNIKAALVAAREALEEVIDFPVDYTDRATLPQLTAAIEEIDKGEE